jgi:hypothetical protein
VSGAVLRAALTVIVDRLFLNALLRYLESSARHMRRCSSRIAGEDDDADGCCAATAGVAFVRGMTSAASTAIRHTRTNKESQLSIATRADHRRRDRMTAIVFDTRVAHQRGVRVRVVLVRRVATGRSAPPQ